MKKSNNSICFMLFLMPLFFFGANGAKVDIMDTEPWPLKMESNLSFDIASKCEMLVFIEVFNSYDSLSESVLTQRVALKSVNTESVTQWKEATKTRILLNFNQLSDPALKELIPISKNSNWNALSLATLEQQFPSTFSAWYAATKLFYEDYVKEQIRLAALFPKITSEIIPFSDIEIQGHNFTDKNFLLTFDDGPTLGNGNTDKLIQVLDTYSLSGMFFVLGDNFEKRLKASSKQALQELYGENRVLSHGKVHKAHQKYAEWQASIDDTNTLIQNVFPTENKNNLLYFRPPYGQRSTDMVTYFTDKKSKIILWNIDSRDWSAKLNVQQVAQREIKLMLLWRKGILLFHDIHSKVQEVLPIVHEYFKDTEITWMKPRDF
ncbi:polysaccharide deacetylase family protein [Cellulophaga sp. E16_2]|uniref:polysaccharide deacetylase family protein n=1 Tax=Cellulophaga sp. E16_2 TaxID=2789297 RepID=UPI001A91E931|nr:polysaccharide deacetylase family protein [Cellulophaga sp. E16_2]MBO0593673.1 polysaccharide deacetylase family protein [Cellulophaga sp. E16_2]